MPCSPPERRMNACPRAGAIARRSRYRRRRSADARPTRCDWFDGIDALLPCFARIVAAIDDAAETDVIAVTRVDAGDLGKPVPTGAMCGGDVAVNGGDVRRPLDDPAGIVAGQTPSWAGPVPGGIGRKRKLDQSE